MLQEEDLEVGPHAGPQEDTRVHLGPAVELGREVHGGPGQEVRRAEHLHAGDQGAGDGGGEEGAGHRLVPPDVPALAKGARVEDVEEPSEHPGDVLVGQDIEGTFEEGREEMGRGRSRVLHQHREGPREMDAGRSILDCYRLPHVIIVVIAICICLKFRNSFTFLLFV